MADENVHIACEDGNLWSVQNYVKKNPSFDINAPDHTGRTCLMLAAENGHEKIADFLIHACHANITKQDQFNQRSAVHLACRKTRGSNPECMKELITDGARYNSVKVTVKTATNVMVAAMRFKKKTGAPGGFAAVAAKKKADTSEEPVASAAAPPAAKVKAAEGGNEGEATMPEPVPAA